MPVDPGEGPSRDDYLIAWIASWEFEQAAAVALLDEQYGVPFDFHQPQRDKNRYVFGRIQSHYVVIATLPENSHSATPIAAIAFSMLASFPQIRFALLPGVGSSISSTNNDLDIRLGDVVIGNPNKNDGGLRQYQLFEAAGDLKVDDRGSLSLPPQALLDALSTYRAARQDISEAISDHAIAIDIYHRRSATGEPGYEYPGSTEDRLFRTSYTHVPGEGCQNCDPHQQVGREKRENVYPRVHYGKIASVNLAEGSENKMRVPKLIGDRYICLETEASGLTNDFPCLAIRGICDYADSHANGHWRNYAAAAAALIAKKLLHRLSLDSLLGSRTAAAALLDGIVANTATSGHSRDVAKGIQHPEYNQKLQRWLAAPDPSTDYTRALQRRQDGTGCWFLESDEFSQWKSNSNTRLWINGAPGSGKSVLTSAIVQQLEMDPSHTVLYFFFDSSDVGKRSLGGMVRSLIIQLYQLHESTRTHLDSLFSVCHEEPRKQPSIGALCNVLTQMVQKMGDVCILIDALDECDTRKDVGNTDVLSWLRGLNLALKECRILITSRKQKSSEAFLKGWLRPEHRLDMLNEFVAADIRKYIRTRLVEDERFSQWRAVPEVQEQIETTLTNKADGNFQYASLALGALGLIRDYAEMRATLASASPTLPGLYKSLLGDFQQPEGEKTRRLLQLVLFAVRPLQTEELDNAVSLKTQGGRRLDPLYRKSSDLAWAPASCSNLIEVRPSGTVTLVHSTVREYLTSGLDNAIQPYFTEEAGSAEIAKVCLELLLQIPEIEGDQDLDQVRLCFPLAIYAAKYWMHHAAATNELDNEVIDLSMRLLLRPIAFKNVSKLYISDTPGGPSSWIRNWYKLPSPLYYASWGGLSQAVRLLLHHGEGIDSHNGWCGTALHVACAMGHQNVVEILLANHADPNTKNTTGLTPLFYAAKRGHDPIVRLLIDNGANLSMFENGPLAKYLKRVSEEKEHVRSETGSHHSYAKASTFSDSEYASNTGLSIAEYSTNATSLSELTIKRHTPHMSTHKARQDVDLQVSPKGKNAAIFDSDMDKGTNYSGGSGISDSKINEFVVKFADKLLHSMWSKNPDQSSRDRVKTKLPDLLKAFALKLGQNAEKQMHRDVVLFTHKYRGQIAAQFEGSFCSQEDEAQGFQNQRSDTIPPQLREERTSTWLETLADMDQCDSQSLLGIAEDTEHDRETDDRDEPCLDEQRDSEDDIEENMVPNHSVYRDFVVDTPAYQWLLAELNKEIRLKSERSEIAEVIKRTIKSSLCLSRKISAKKFVEIRQLTFEIAWDPKTFLEEQRFLENPREATTINQLMEPSKAIGRAITITGSVNDAQVLTTEQYLRQTWPTTGEWVLKVVKDVVTLVSGQRVSYTLPDGTKLTGWMEGSKFFAQTCGTAPHLAEVGEQLAWISTALRSSVYSDGIALCTPFVHAFRIDPIQANGVHSFCCRIDFIMSKSLQAPNPANGQCWHNIFRNPILVEGFPILRRSCPDTGLEAPLEIMAALADTDYVTEFNGKSFIKGFSTMLVPTMMASDILVWHLLYAKEGERISYWDVTLPHLSIGKAELERTRHVIGWCSEAKLLAGTKSANYRLTGTNLPPPSKDCLLDRATISGGYHATGALSFALSQAHKPVRVELSSYLEQLEWVHDVFVVLWDENAKRGWLVNGTTALLHIIRALLKHKRSGPFGCTVLLDPDEISEASEEKKFGTDAAVEVLCNNSNRVLRVKVDNIQIEEMIVQEGHGTPIRKTEEKRTYTLFQDIVQRVCKVLEQMVDQQNPRDRNGFSMKCRLRKHIEGWDIESFFEKQKVYPSVATLQVMGDGWVDFIGEIGAVTIFANGFGEIIEPSHMKGFCSRWKQLPKDRYYLAVCCPDLSKATKSSSRARPAIENLCKSVNFSEPCSCRGTNHTEQHALLPQSSHRSKSCPLLPHTGTVSLESQGAMVFSHNITWKWKGKGHSSGALEDPGPSDVSEPLFDDSALNSCHVCSPRSNTVSKSSQGHEQPPIQRLSTDNPATADADVREDTAVEQLQSRTRRATTTPDTPIGSSIQEEQGEPAQPSQQSLRDQSSPKKSSKAAGPRSGASPDDCSPNNGSKKSKRHGFGNIFHKLFKK